MNFVKSLDVFGVPAKEIPCIQGKGAPTETTAGAVGSLYMNTDNGEMFKCTAADENAYTWRAIGGTVSWNDLTDRPFYRDVTYSYEYAWLDETVTFTEQNGVYVSAQVSIGINLIENQMFHVLWDGKEYYTPVRLHNGVAYLGNLSIVEAGAPDTKEPFYMYDADYRKDVIFKTREAGTTHDITARAAYEESVSLKQIHADLIPDTIARTADVQALIDAALASIEIGTSLPDASGVMF